MSNLLLSSFFHINWQAFLGWFDSPPIASFTKSFAFWTTAICVVFAIRCAQEFCSTMPKLFSIFAFYALSWALLLPYYGDYFIGKDPMREIFPSFAAFIAVYIGGMLRRIGPEDFQAKEKVGVLDKWSLILLGVFIAPELFSIPQEYLLQPASWHPPLVLYAVTSVLVVAVHAPTTFWSHILDPMQRLVYCKIVMHVLEFGSLLWGIRLFYGGDKAWRLILWPILPYLGFDVVYGCFQCWMPPNAEMPPFFLLMFALCKCIYVPIFSYMVLIKASDSFCRMTWWQRCGRLLPIKLLLIRLFQYHMKG